MAVVRGGARKASTTIAATAGGTVASTGSWAISPGGTGGGWKADGGSGRGCGVPGGNFAVNHSGGKLGRGLIVPLLKAPGQTEKKQRKFTFGTHLQPIVWRASVCPLTRFMSVSLCLQQELHMLASFLSKKLC